MFLLMFGLALFRLDLKGINITHDPFPLGKPVEWFSICFSLLNIDKSGDVLKSQRESAVYQRLAM